MFSTAPLTIATCKGNWQTVVQQVPRLGDETNTEHSVFSVCHAVPANVIFGCLSLDSGQRPLLVV